jgi:toxin FitB
MEAADESLLYLSVLTLGQIRKDVAGLPPGKRQTQVVTWLELDLQARFSGRILSIDGSIAERGVCYERRRSARAGHDPPSTACWQRPRFITILQSFRGSNDFASIQPSLLNPSEA